jgi:biotin-dependent carboxylase-like uncharacterized protein
VIEVLHPGPLSLVEDLGRTGRAALGVGRSGAADRASLRLGNRLVGNAEGAAGIEVTFGGLAVRFVRPATIALTGAPCTVTVDGGRPVGVNAPASVAAGTTLRMGAPATGLRTYLCVRGGVDVQPVLGSRSTDVLSGIGPPPLVPGMLLPVGPPPPQRPLVDVAAVAEPSEQPVLRVVTGPRADWFDDNSLSALCATAYEVSLRSNRIAVRLRGPALRRTVEDELPPEGLVPGAVQVPPDGQPVLFLADHPVTGGYPVIAVVRDCDVGAAAQLRPGQQVRFHR